MADLFGGFVKTSVGFDDAFWPLVPHKVNKEASRKAWNKLKPNEREAAQKHVKAFYEWFKKTYPTASPLHPSTYLNGKRWQDIEDNDTSHTHVDVNLIRKMCQSTSDAVRRAGEDAARRQNLSFGRDA